MQIKAQELEIKKAELALKQQELVLEREQERAVKIGTDYGEKGEEIARADQAKQILEHPLYVEALATVKEALVQYLLDTKVAEEVERDRLYITIKALDLVNQHITSVLETGKLAEREQEQFLTE
jgi:hypothetical protein